MFVCEESLGFGLLVGQKKQLEINNQSWKYLPDELVMKTIISGGESMSTVTLLKYYSVTNETTGIMSTIMMFNALFVAGIQSKGFFCFLQSKLLLLCPAQ